MRGATTSAAVWLTVTAAALGLPAAACSRDTPPAADAPAAGGKDSAGGSATPVRTAPISRADLAVVVSGPGRTDALDVQKVRAPFIGTLRLLTVVIGDRVQSGQVIGAFVAQASDAALAGAEVMVRGATTPAERSDAARALELAKQNLVETPLRAPRAGVVVSRSASQGDLLNQGDSIVSIASAGSIVFVARIAQNDLPQVRPGQRATVALPGRSAELTAEVHGLLPADTSAMSVPVRLDIRTVGAPIPLGLFGTAHITVGEHRGAVVVPNAAVLRDDVSGTSRVATVTAAGVAHWVTVRTGVQQGRSVEVVSPPLSPGSRVIISGQVGLPEGSHVRETSDSIGAQR
jgi:RND family efflux transporter MFP subunit